MTRASELEETEVLVEGNDDAELDILNELNSSPDDTTWWFRVSRVLGAAKDGMKEPFLFEGDGSVMTGIHLRLQQEHGTGKYRVRVLRNNRLYRRFDIEVEAPKRIEPQPAALSEMSTVLAAIEKSNQRVVDMMERMLTQRQVPVVPPTDPFAGVQQIAATMQSLSSMFLPKQDVGTSTVDAIMKGVELALKFKDESSGDSEGEVSFLGVLRDAIKGPIGEKIGEVLATSIAASPQIPVSSIAASPQIPVSSIAPPAKIPNDIVKTQSHVSKQPEPTQEQQIQQQISRDIAYLITRAQQKSDPAIYAEWVMDNWPKPLLVQFSQQPNPLAILELQYPATVPYRDWFKELIDELLVIVKDALEAEQVDMHVSTATPSANNANGNSRRPGGSESHTQTHVGIGEAGEEEFIN